jgi:hypothetical protein
MLIGQNGSRDTRPTGAGNGAWAFWIFSLRCPCSIGNVEESERGNQPAIVGEFNLDLTSTENCDFSEV